MNNTLTKTYISSIVSPLRLRLSAVRIPSNISNRTLTQPRVQLKQLNLFTAKSFHLPSLAVSNVFHNGPRVRLSPLKSSVIHFNLTNKTLSNKRRRAYPEVYKCNTKSCRCCKHISCKSTIKSSVNGRNFSINIDSDID